MKNLVQKLLVATNLLLVLGLLAFFARDVRHLFSSSTDALTGNYRARPEEGEMGARDDFAAAAPPMAAMAAADADEKHARAERKMVAKEAVLGSLGGRGMGAGGGGLSQAFGLAGAGGSALGGRGTLGSASVSMRGGAMAKPEAFEIANEAQSAPEAPVRTRAWFPETFLFEPRIVTDASGLASLDVKVPDRLTSWRILALAHSREGAQAGAVTTFLGTLPSYVDPVVPPFLRAGDEVKLPVQVVNTTSDALAKALTVEAVGAKLSGGAATVKVAGGATEVSYVTLKADEPGTVTLKAALAGGDAVVREFPVQPTGRPFTERHAGSLAAPRELTLDLPVNLDAKTARARLVVYPGALALLRSELGRASFRGGVAEDAYALRLAGDAPKLLEALGDAADREALRTTALVLTQRVLRDSRSVGPGDAALLAESAAAHRDSPVLSRLCERLAQQLAAQQRPDGTFGGGGGQTAGQMLVTTADAVRALAAAATDDAGKLRATAAALKASGAVERQLSLVQDAYTAAALVASGAAEGRAAEQLREKVRAAVTLHGDGTRSLTIDGPAHRADGSTPTSAEADALAILALDPAADAAMRADLGASLLAAYAPGTGWGDGRTNLVALRAAVELFKTPVPAAVKVTLAMDGQPVAEGNLAAQAKDELALDAAIPAGKGHHAWTVRAEPAVPGLGFSLEFAGFQPWQKEPMQGGLELSVGAPKEAAVGKAAPVTLEAAAPAGMPLTLRHALPAGVQADRPSLEKLVSDGIVQSFTIEDGAVRLDVRARNPGETFVATYKVVPTLAGVLHASASTLEVAGRPELAHHVLPAVWTVR